MKKFIALIAATVLGISSLPSHANDSVRLAVTDIEGLELLQQEFGPFQQAMADMTG